MKTSNSTFTPSVMWSFLPLSYSGYLVPPSENIRLSGRRMFVLFFWRSLKQSPVWGPRWKASWCHTPLRRFGRNLICCEIYMKQFTWTGFPFCAQCNPLFKLVDSRRPVLVRPTLTCCACPVIMVKDIECSDRCGWVICNYELSEFSNLLAKLLVLAASSWADNLGHLGIFKADVILCFFMMTAEGIKRVCVCLVCVYHGKDIGELAKVSHKVTKN